MTEAAVAEKKAPTTKASTIAAAAGAEIMGGSAPPAKLKIKPRDPLQ